MSVAAVVVLVLVAAGVVLRQCATARVTPSDVVWLVGAGPDERVPDDEAGVVVRYLERHRQHRLVGGLLGVTFAVVVGLRWYQSVGFGFAQRSPLADVLFCGVGGVLVGALYAEGFRLRPAPGARVASLAPHPTAPLAGTVWTARAVLATSLLVALALLLTGSGPAAVVSAGVGTVLVTVAELTRRRIVDRRRPVHPERVDRLDRRLRSFAAGSVAHLELAAAVLTAMWVLAWWSAATPDVPYAVDVLRTCAGLAGLVIAVVLLHRAAPRAPRRARTSP